MSSYEFYFYSLEQAIVLCASLYDVTGSPSRCHSGKVIRSPYEVLSVSSTGSSVHLCLQWMTVWGVVEGDVRGRGAGVPGHVSRAGTVASTVVPVVPRDVGTLLGSLFLGVPVARLPCVQIRRPFW